MDPKPVNREIALPAQALAALREAIGEAGGEGAALRVMRLVGHAAGTSGAPGLSRGDSDPAARSEAAFWHELGDYLSRRGWGSLSHSAPHPGVGLIETTEWVETGADSPFSEGLLAGLLSSVAQAEVAVIRVPREADLAAFAYGAPDTIESLQAHLAGGKDLDSALTAL